MGKLLKFPSSHQVDTAAVTRRIAEFNAEIDKYIMIHATLPFYRVFKRARVASILRALFFYRNKLLELLL